MLHARLDPPATVAPLEVDESTDYTGQLLIDDLENDTVYRYELWFERDGRRGDAVEGQFRSAPERSAPAPLRLSFAGDFAGQNLCRHAEEDMPLFEALADETADLFVGLGDMIYADSSCGSTSPYGSPQLPDIGVPATALADFRSKWRYVRGDPGFQRLLARTPYLGIWDDHEVVNDFSPSSDFRETPPFSKDIRLMPLGLRAFNEYTPIALGDRMYRSVRWGRHAEVLLLDNRSYRDDKSLPDGAGKTMLGQEQLDWLLERVENSDATWLIVVTGVPLSLPTGWPPEFGRDGWANGDANAELTVDGIPQSDTGYERELGIIVSAMAAREANVLFLSADVHHAHVLRYEPVDGYVFHQVVTGPGNAGVFPGRPFDRSFGASSLFLYEPNSPDDITSWEEAKRWFNYGVLEIDDQGALTTSVRGVNGRTLYSLDIKPRQAARPAP